jgi:hypothetical protein
MEHQAKTSKSTSCIMAVLQHRFMRPSPNQVWVHVQILQGDDGKGFQDDTPSGSLYLLSVYEYRTEEFLECLM